LRLVAFAHLPEIVEPVDLAKIRRAALTLYNSVSDGTAIDREIGVIILKGFTNNYRESVTTRCGEKAAERGQMGSLSILLQEIEKEAILRVFPDGIASLSVETINTQSMNIRDANFIKEQVVLHLEDVMKKLGGGPGKVVLINVKEKHLDNTFAEAIEELLDIVDSNLQEIQRQLSSISRRISEGENTAWRSLNYLSFFRDLRQMVRISDYMSSVDSLFNLIGGLDYVRKVVEILRFRSRELQKVELISRAEVIDNEVSKIWNYLHNIFKRFAFTIKPGSDSLPKHMGLFFGPFTVLGRILPFLDSLIVNVFIWIGLELALGLYEERTFGAISIEY
jgi:hypothetical protein